MGNSWPRPFKYYFLRYNQYGVLRANWPLKFCLIFLCRHILLLVALGAMQFKGSSGQIMTHLTPLLDNAFIIPTYRPWRCST